ncbi:hypothetical protein ACFODZ_09515 [Marinicella sediminis]|uniref:Uncharacterized protein n=1 Tax=Marinicella sediminis TaxID=1792834 RepID=A0ABV7J8N5_9GAMM|nr:hypothetical protein [Marinicella sediminis]
MKKQPKEKHQYHWFTCLFFALFGFVFLWGFITEGHHWLMGDGSFSMALVGSGFLSYLLLYTAYKGQAPSWFNDRNVFGDDK